MTTNDDIWTVAIGFMVAFYLWAVLVAVRHLWRSRNGCLSCTYRQAWLRSALFAFVVTPSVITDFFLFSFPGPAALGFFVLLPGVFLAEGHRMELLLVTSVYYVLPWIACTLLIFGVWWLIRRLQASRRSA